MGLDQARPWGKIAVGFLLIFAGLVTILLGIEAGHPLHRLFDKTRIAGPTGVRKRHPMLKAFHHVKKHVSPTNHCAKKCFNVVEYGAIADGETLATDSIYSALEALAKAEGGTLFFPAGKFLTGPFDLVSHTNMVLHDDCLLQFVSGEGEVVGKYPGGEIEWDILPNIEHPSPTAYGYHNTYRQLIGGHHLTDVTIRGGTINGGGKFWWERDGNHHAPNGIHILESTDITVEDITLESFPKFVLRPQMCSRVTIRNVIINNSKKSKGTNGIVIDSSEDVVVSDCTIHTGDKEDTIVMKAGKDYFGRERNRPTRNVLVERCTVTNGHAVSVGSETSGGIYNIHFKGIEFEAKDGQQAGSLRVKSQRGRGGVVDGVVFEDIRGHHVLYALEFYLWYACDEEEDDARAEECRRPTNKTATPVVRNIKVKNLELHGATREVGVIEGLPESPFQNLVLENVHVDHAHKGWKCQRAVPGCTWDGGGCAIGEAINVVPPLPKNCLRADMPSINPLVGSAQ